jgi:hypothetical protein
MIRGMAGLFQEIRRIGFNPSEWNLKPSFPTRLSLSENVQRVLGQLCGETIGGTKLVKAGLDGELLVASHGSGHITYTVITGTAPAAYHADHSILTSNRWDSFYIVVEGEDALIRFRGVNEVDYGGDIPVKEGVLIVDFKCTGIQVKKRNVTAPTYTIVGFA